MDDFYTECQEKLHSNADPAVAIAELAGISLQDFPCVQLCKFSEQMATLLTVTFQSTACPTPELLAKFQTIHGQLEKALIFMEQIIAAKVEFPGHSKMSDDYWLWE